MAWYNHYSKWHPTQSFLNICNKKLCNNECCNVVIENNQLLCPLHLNEENLFNNSLNNDNNFMMEVDDNKNNGENNINNVNNNYDNKYLIIDGNNCQFDKIY